MRSTANKKISRRKFIKGALITAAALMLGGGLISGWLQRVDGVLAALIPRAPRALPAGELAIPFPSAIAPLIILRPK